jgi:predicted acyl esterase
MEYRSRTPLGTAHRSVRRVLKPDVQITAPPDGVVFERDVEVAVRDGTTLRVDVLRPEAAGRYPVLLSAQPYGKDDIPARKRSGRVIPKQYYMAANNAPISHSAWTSWEAPDPAFWVPRGYIVINADLRGWGKSDGVPKVLDSAQEGRDLHDLIEWAAEQSWCNGRIGMSGVSYLAISQWAAAATRPPHLRAISPWEGFTDAYPDFAYPGGIRENGFMVLWSALQRLQRPKSASFRREQKRRPLYDSWWAERCADLERIEVPALVCASFSDHSLHSRGTFEGFRRIGSDHKWLYTHRGPKWSTYYSSTALGAQAQFFDHFLRGIDSGILEQAPIRIEVRESRSRIAAVHSAHRWPPTEIEPLVLHLDPYSSQLVNTPLPQAVATLVPSKGIRFSWKFDRLTDVVGPMRLRLPVSTAGADLTLFAGVRKFHRGREVVFEGSYGFTEDIVTRGWLRASHRFVDAERSTFWEAYHPHTTAEAVPKGETVELDLTLLPSATRFAPGDLLVLELNDRWFFPANPITGQWPAVYQPSKRQRWSIHAGGTTGATLTVPIWPWKASSADAVADGPDA